MAEAREDFDTSDEPRAGPREIAVCLERVDASIAHRGDFPPALRETQGAIFAPSLFRRITARGDHDDFGSGSDNFLARNPKRWSAPLSKRVSGSGEFDHLRHPVPPYIEGLQPFEEGDSRAFRRAMDLLLDDGQSCPNLLQKPLGSGPTASFFPDPQNVAPDIAQVLRIKAKDLRPAIQARKRRRQVAGGSGANMAQVLSDNQIGLQTLEQVRVHGVKALTARDKIADHAIDFGGRRSFRNARVNYDRFGARRRGEIAFVADADDFAIETQREQDFRRGGKQRHDAHEATLAHRAGPAYL